VNLVILDSNEYVIVSAAWYTYRPLKGVDCSLRYYNGSQRTQNNKQTAAGTTMDTTLPFPEALEIIRKPENARSQNIIKEP